jgi:hypothetical protein
MSQPGQSDPMRTELAFRLARPAGFEPATRCLEGSRSIHLSYGRLSVSVHGKDHMKATQRSQCTQPSEPHHPGEDYRQPK